MIRISHFSSFSKHKLKKLVISEIEAILDIIPEATLLVDGRDGLIASANAAATELSAYTRAELTQMSIKEIFTEANNQDLLDDIRKSIGRMTYLELPMVKRGGGKINVRVTPITLDRESEKVVITFEPVSLIEQQREERERQHQVWNGLITIANALLERGIEEALNLALEAGFYLTGSACVALYRANGDHPGLKKTNELGTKDLLPGIANPYDLAALQKPTLWIPGKRTETDLHRHARMSNISYLATAPVGQRNALVGLIAAASDSSKPPGEILNILKFMGILITSIIQEHTLLTHLQNTLKEHNSALKKHTLITGSIQDGIVILNPDLTISEMNTLAEESLGYISSEVHGQTIDNILISANDLKPLLERALHDRLSSKLDGIRLYRRNGQAFLASVQTLPIIEAEGLAGVIIIIRDLSEQEEYRTLNQQLEQRALLGEVTASFAHEVRNPINNISTGLQLLAVNLPADDPNQDYVNRLKGDCDRLAELIKSSLTIVRPMEFKLKHVDLGSLMKFILDRHQARLLKANIQSNLQIESNVPPINGDFSALEHVFQNLIENAIQAMAKEGGTLSVKVRLFQKSGESDYVEVNISDTGLGIPDEVRDRIFEPFFTTKLNGTGLGLAIVKRILTAHKGVINVESIPGATVFQVRLPVAKIT
jgi:two-component system, NtrC family, sensor histidine kinase AtoS